MIPPLNFAVLKEQLDCIAVAKRLGWRPTWERPLVARGPCLWPECRSRKPRSLAVVRHGYYCHKCHRMGDAIRLWAELTGLDPLAAALALCHEFRIDPPRK